ncbi:hypothetical protein GDO86_009078 [Hymenochirus boettgeri]|uniref:Uncharacterized protein n=1 Tax=Hymenochirus boettgeri TaxID=247094 RepID=A0A8T2JF27_9PIPI|nr:hypothetical protein GDO86_009078 [Hymenochirus boettgeri]
MFELFFFFCNANSLSSYCGFKTVLSKTGKSFRSNANSPWLCQKWDLVLKGFNSVIYYLWLCSPYLKARFAN